MNRWLWIAGAFLAGTAVGAMLAAAALGGAMSTGGAQRTPVAAASPDASHASTATVALERDLRLTALNGRDSAFITSGLTREPSADLTKHQFGEGIAFYAYLSAISTAPASVTFDVLTPHDIPDYGTDLSNRHRHSQTLQCASAHIPVVSSRDDPSVPSLLNDAGEDEATLLTFSEFATAVRRRPELYLKEVGYIVHVDRDGKITAIEEAVSPG